MAHPHLVMSTAPPPIEIDFLCREFVYLCKTSSQKNQLIARAAGIKKGVRPWVLDATMGLGRDSYILACLGCKVWGIERHPVVFAELQRALKAAQQATELSHPIHRLHIQQGEAVTLMAQYLTDGTRPDVVLLDPMYPERRKSALNKKSMRVMHALVGADSDADALLSPARALATSRVIVKRPRHAETLRGEEPSFVVEGRSSRFDVYIAGK